MVECCFFFRFSNKAHTYNTNPQHANQFPRVAPLRKWMGGINFPYCAVHEIKMPRSSKASRSDRMSVYAE